MQYEKLILAIVITIICCYDGLNNVM